MRTHRGRWGLATAVAALGLATATVGATAADGATATAAAEGDSGTQFSATIGADGTITSTQQQVKTTVQNGLIGGGTKPIEPTFPQKPTTKLDPKLAAAVKSGDPAARQHVVVTFTDDGIKVPQFPSLNPDLARSSPANSQVQAQSDALVANLTSQRAAGYQALSTQFGQLGARTVSTFWLFKGMELDAPTSALGALAKRPDVSYIEPSATGAAPPSSNGVDGDDEIVARGLMRTDPYYNLGQTSGYIGIIDTGVRSTHKMFNNPTKPWIREDLTTTTNPNPEDDCWNHGTSTMGILTGNNSLGERWRGLTGITVDSFKVYPANCGGADATATGKAFQRAVQVGDRVIVAELQFGVNGYDSVQVAADAAYDAGAVVLAANGNNGPDASTVNSPAAAQKVLGIGDVGISGLQTVDSQSRGPAADGRTKPDLVAPTNAETASNAADDALRAFSGTSGAVPHAAGAAALARNLFRGTNATFDPGLVNAFMIATGTPYAGSNIPAYTNSTTGAGGVDLPLQGRLFSQALSVGNQQTTTTTILVQPEEANDATKQLNVAIWWPEAPTVHNDVDLTLIDPNGTVRASSLSISNVFERVHIAGPLIGGTWTIQVRGYSVTGTQNVFMGALAALQ
jgi:serine protease AprX